MRNSQRGLLFFNPPYRWLVEGSRVSETRAQVPIVPLGPASLFEYLRVYSGLPCDFYYAPDHSIRRIKELIRTYHPLLIGISCNSYNRFACLMIARIAKDIDPSIRVVLGGVHATFLDEQILLNYPFVDYVIRHEGEVTLLDLVEALKKEGGFSNIDGLSFRDGERVVRNKSRPRIPSLDDLPLIDYEYFESQGMKNNDPRGYGARTYPVETSRGCTFSCKFCITANMFGRRIVYRSFEKVIEQIGRIPQGGGQMIYFNDMDFTINKNHVRELCRALIKNNINIPWHCSTRVDLIDEDIFRMMKEAGCVVAFFGVESLSGIILKGMNKRYTPAYAIEKIKIAAGTGMLARLSFIIGFPGETDDTLKESMMNCMKLPPGIQAHVAPLMIFPGTAIYDQALREGFDEVYWLKDHDDAIPYYEGALPLPVLKRWEQVFNSMPFSDGHVDAKAGKNGMDGLLRNFHKAQK